MFFYKVVATSSDSERFLVRIFNGEFSEANNGGLSKANPDSLSRFIMFFPPVVVADPAPVLVLPDSCRPWFFDVSPAPKFSNDFSGVVFSAVSRLGSGAEGVVDEGFYLSPTTPIKQHAALKTRRRVSSSDELSLYEKLNGVGGKSNLRPRRADARRVLMEVASCDSHAFFYHPCFKALEESLRFALRGVFCLDVCHGILELLNCGYAHNDLKGPNVLLTSLGYFKLTDHGLTRPLGSHYDYIRGTPEFKAPELLLQGIIGPTSDLFSLGAVLFQLIAGKSYLSFDPSDEIKAGLADVKLGKGYRHLDRALCSYYRTPWPLKRVALLRGYSHSPLLCLALNLLHPDSSGRPSVLETMTTLASILEKHDPQTLRSKLSELAQLIDSSAVADSVPPPPGSPRQKRTKLA